MVLFWGIEYERVPNPRGDPPGLLTVPLPWAGDERAIGSAVLVFETRELARTGLEHSLALTGASTRGYGLRPFTPQELADVLEERPEGGGFEHVALNPIPSRYFPGADAYSAGWPTDEFVAELRALRSAHP